jgi:hypothetical protein
MMPSMGRIVFYHFHHILEDDKTAVLLARPALVVDANGDGVCELHVFFSVGDRTMTRVGTPDDPGMDPCKLDVRPHLEHAGEIGKIERRKPDPGTWTWPPRVG